MTGIGNRVSLSSSYTKRQSRLRRLFFYQIPLNGTHVALCTNATYVCEVVVCTTHLHRRVFQCRDDVEVAFLSDHTLNRTACLLPKCTWVCTKACMSFMAQDHQSLYTVVSQVRHCGLAPVSIHPNERSFPFRERRWAQEPDLPCNFGPGGRFVENQAQEHSSRNDLAAANGRNSDDHLSPSVRLETRLQSLRMLGSRCLQPNLSSIPYTQHSEPPDSTAKVISVKQVARRRQAIAPCHLDGNYSHLAHVSIPKC